MFLPNGISFYIGGCLDEEVPEMDIKDGQHYSCSLKVLWNLGLLKFSNKSNLAIHIVKHVGGETYPCLVCNFKAKHIVRLKQHMKIHSEKNLECHYCGYKSAIKTHMKVHIMTHTGEKPRSCPICSFKAIWKSEITKHLQTHKEKCVELWIMPVQDVSQVQSEVAHGHPFGISSKFFWVLWLQLQNGH